MFRQELGLESIRYKFFLVVTFCLLLNCSSGVDSTHYELNYSLASHHVSVPENTLHFNDVSGNLRFKIFGDGFSSSVKLGEMHPLTEEVPIQVDEVGEYSLHLVVYQSDETPLFEDTLTWTYSQEAPIMPVVSFDKKVKISEMRRSLTVFFNGKNLITVMNEKGEVPSDICTWQFNFKFSLQ